MGNKTVPTPVPANEFVGRLEDGRRDEARILIDLLEDVSGEPPVMWGGSIIGFGSYHYRYDSGREGDMCRIGFSPRKAELVIYLAGGFERYETILRRLGRHRTGKSCLYLKRLSDADPTSLRELLIAELAYMDATYPRA